MFLYAVDMAYIGIVTYLVFFYAVDMAWLI